MELLKAVKRRSFLSEVVYIALNIALALTLLIIIKTTGSLWLAFAIVLLSKWRVLAVRVRYWFANVQADLVSVIVSIGYVVGLYNINLLCINDSKALFSELLLVVLYIVWLLFLKNQSKRGYVALQAGVSLIAGSYAVYSMSYGWDSLFVVALIWLIGYSTCRHVLSSYDEDHITLVSTAWGLLMAEIAWLAYHWTIAYPIPIFEGIMIPQISIIMFCISFLVYKCYESYFHRKKFRVNDILLPLLFTLGIIVVLIFAFNGVHPELKVCGL
jgi:hypothetical protein